MASKNIAPGTPGGSKGGVWGKSDSKVVSGSIPSHDAADQLKASKGTAGGSKAGR